MEYSAKKSSAGMDLKRLDFGAPAAERDFTHGLKKYFLESASYRRFRDGTKTILIGNRGAGKSAIFKMLAENYKMGGAYVIELTPDDYSYEMLSRTLTKEAQGAWAKQGAYAAAWKYLIYVLAMKKICVDSPGLKNKETKEIFNYLRDNFRGFQQSPLDILVSQLKRIEGVKLGFYEAAIKVRELQSLYKLEEINPLLPHLERVCRRTPVYVLVDELDRGWDASEDAKAFVAGLFQAAVSINDAMESFRVLISLRQELYYNIPSLYEDAQKVWDLIEVIKWDRASLLHLMAKRISHSYPALSEVPPEETWAAVFKKTRQKGETNSFDYIVNRTLYRPREVIQFCTQAKDKAMLAQEFPISFASLQEVELNYSESRTKDIAAEYRNQHPGLWSIFEAFRGRAPVFEKEELEDLCLRIILREIPISREATWLEVQEPEFLISILWQVGFLRAEIRKHDSSAKTDKFLGHHEISSLNLRSVKRFDVHPMFRANLGMVEV